MNAKRIRPGGVTGADQKPLDAAADKDTASTESRTVDWLPVHFFAEPYLAAVGSWPMAGTLAWQRLDDDDPRKLAAVIACAPHWILRIECNQEAMADASKAIAASTDWTALAAGTARGRGAAYIERRAS